MPIADETVGRPVRHLFQCELHVAAAAGRPEQGADDVVAVGAAEVGPERLTPAVGEVSRILEISELRKLAAPHRVAHPHRRVRIHVPERDVLGHSFDEPQGNAVEACGHVAATDTGDVVLERVRQLVTDHMVGFKQRCAHWKNDAPLEALRDAFASLHRKDVRLIVIGVIRVENQRLPATELVA